MMRALAARKAILSPPPRGFSQKFHIDEILQRDRLARRRKVRLKIFQGLIRINTCRGELFRGLTKGRRRAAIKIAFTLLRQHERQAGMAPCAKAR
jgi:hypothetical protein